MTVPVDLTAPVRTLLKQKVWGQLATLQPDGSPQITVLWVDTDGRYVLINTVEGYQKLKNLRRDPRVALTVSMPEDPARYISIRGEVVEITTEGAREHIEELSQRYFDGPYPFHANGTRVLIKIAPTRVSNMLERPSGPQNKE